MICSDKTGTLTQNMMTFTCLWNMQKVIYGVNSVMNGIKD